MVPVSSFSYEVAVWAIQASTVEGSIYEKAREMLPLSDEAIKNLCNVNSPVTSNILHLVAKKRDVEYVSDEFENGPNEYSTLSLQANVIWL